MEVQTPTTIFNRDLAKGFIPKAVEQDRKEETLLLLKCLFQIEKNIENLPQGTRDLILSNQLNYSEMFMQNTLRDLKKRNNVSRYPEGWFRAVAENFEKTVFVDDDSDLCFYKEIPVKVTIFEFESIPRLQFETASTYVTWMLALYNLDHDALESFFEKSDAKIDRIKFFENAVAQSSDDTEILVEFFLYTALNALTVQNPRFNSQLIQSAGSEIISKVSFPPNLVSERGSNFYGKLLMRLREDILQ
jgi:hypothetical protein